MKVNSFVFYGVFEFVRVQVLMVCFLSGPQNRRVATGESYVVSSDEDEDTPLVLSAAVMSSLEANSSSR